MWLFRSIVILVGVIAFLWIGMSNADQNVDFSFFNKEYPGLSLNMLMLLVFAAVFSFLILVFSEVQLRHMIGRQRKEIVRLERELAALRNLPLDEGEAERVDA
ncbi:MAG: LapA family protein [bacterium]